MLETHPRAVLGRAAVACVLIAGLLAPSVLAASAPGGGAGRTGGGGGSPVVDLARPHAEDAVLVGFVDAATENDRATARRAAGAASSRPVSRLAQGVERLQLAPGASVSGAIAALKSNPRVRYAEPDYHVTRGATSNDTYSTNGSLWGMYGDASPLQANPFGSGAAEAWAGGHTGSRNIVIGVIDEGIQVTHPDLAANI